MLSHLVSVMGCQSASPVRNSELPLHLDQKGIQHVQVNCNPGRECSVMQVWGLNFHKNWHIFILEVFGRSEIQIDYGFKPADKFLMIFNFS